MAAVVAHLEVVPIHGLAVKIKGGWRQVENELKGDGNEAGGMEDLRKHAGLWEGEWVIVCQTDREGNRWH